ncbi:MORN repeat-containing protein 1-like [Denticeps clupeoides]|uniref:MORN repeat-containing protein 1-like n=1 Tax=Denticeps clupeoides TaxID=299321 RepID=UPI0010A2BB6D|nr:MORN repeat-containing protein 1 [Denticeps clupeoides]
MATRDTAVRDPPYYVGDFKKQLRHGFGVYVYPNGYFRYEGEWKMGKKHGRGKLVMKDGSYYEGEFVDGEIEGNGLRYWAKSGASYSGQFSNGELHGFGVLQCGDGGRYEGEFSFGLKEGHGLLVDKDGHRYEGSFHQNKKHGEGQMRYRNGDQFEGGWLQDHKQGHGVMHFKDGSVYEGQWRSNQFSGKGTLLHSSGVIYEGPWSNGKPRGGASKIVIDRGDILEAFLDSPFTVEVHLVTEEEEPTQGEHGRLLQVSAGVRLPEIHPSSLDKIIKDLPEKPISTKFGFDFISYPLMERVFESRDSGGSMAPLPAAKSGSAQAGSPLPGVERESGSGSDETVLGRGSLGYLDGKPGSNCLEGDSTTLTESFAAIPAAHEDDTVAPPACQRTVDGQAKFTDLLLAPPPPDYKLFELMDEMEKKNHKTSASKTSIDKQAVVKSGSRNDMGGKGTGNAKKCTLDCSTLRTGEYVIMVSEVTSPPFLGRTLPPAFALLRISPAKHQGKSEMNKCK